MQSPKKKVGRPRKDGPRDRGGRLLKRSKGGRFASRSDSFPSVAPPIDINDSGDIGGLRRESSKPEPQVGEGSEAAAQAVRAQFIDDHRRETEGQRAAQADSEPSATDWRLLVRVMNGAIVSMLPDFAMMPDEERLISESLGVVIQKRFPSVAEYGPEAALFTAMAAWLGRVIYQRYTKASAVSVSKAADVEQSTVGSPEPIIGEGDSPFGME